MHRVVVKVVSASEGTSGGQRAYENKLQRERATELYLRVTVTRFLRTTLPN